MARKAASKPPAPADPDKLVRQEAGTYRTTDDRFEVREANDGWFIVDAERTNDFGQELILGPYATLKAVREALPAAREAQPERPQRTSAAKTAKPEAKPEPPPKPQTWIDKLPGTDATAVRKLIRALEADEIGDAESLVRRDRGGLFPAVATGLIERRLTGLIDEEAPKDRERARRLVRQAARILTADGATARGAGVPGWTLIEIGPEPEPANRRIILDE